MDNFNEHVGAALTWVGTNPDGEPYRLLMVLVVALGMISEVLGLALKLPSYSFLHRLVQLAWWVVGPLWRLATKAGTTAATAMPRLLRRRDDAHLIITRQAEAIERLSAQLDALQQKKPPAPTTPLSPPMRQPE